jgi:hypothetical protein
MAHPAQYCVEASTITGALCGTVRMTTIIENEPLPEDQWTGRLPPLLHNFPIVMIELARVVRMGDRLDRSLGMGDAYDRIFGSHRAKVSSKTLQMATACPVGLERLEGRSGLLHHSLDDRKGGVEVRGQPENNGILLAGGNKVFIRKRPPLHAMAYTAGFIKLGGGG